MDIPASLFPLHWSWRSLPFGIIISWLDNGCYVGKQFDAYKEKNLPFLYGEVIIGLYLRLGTYIKHHPKDFKEYLKAWYYWKDLIKNVEL
jgi:hypothetical protein